MKTSKKVAKVSKVKAQAQVEAVKAETRQPVVPQASAYVMAKQVVQPWHKKAEDQIVTVSQEKFNRAGFDALMMVGVGEVSAAAVAVAPEKKSVKARINDGFLGMTRKMYRKGCTGQEILEANRDARIARGDDADWAMERAKKDYGYVVREAKKVATAKPAHVEVDKAAVNG